MRSYAAHRRYILMFFCHAFGLLLLESTIGCFDELSPLVDRFLRTKFWCLYGNHCSFRHRTILKSVARWHHSLQAIAWKLVKIEGDGDKVTAKCYRHLEAIYHRCCRCVTRAHLPVGCAPRIIPVYSMGDFEFFSQQEQHVAPMGPNLSWRSHRMPNLPRQISPRGCRSGVLDPEN